MRASRAATAPRWGAYSAYNVGELLADLRAFDWGLWKRELSETGVSLGVIGVEIAGKLARGSQRIVSEATDIEVERVRHSRIFDDAAIEN